MHFVNNKSEIILIAHDNGVASIKCKQWSQLWVWCIVCIITLFMIINETEQCIYSTVGRGDSHIMKYALLTVSSSLSGSTFVIGHYKLYYLFI